MNERFTFAPVGAVLQMNVGDYFSQGRRGWLRFHEKGGKEQLTQAVDHSSIPDVLSGGGTLENVIRDYRKPTWKKGRSGSSSR
jgi:hypothetical protein